MQESLPGRQKRLDCFDQTLIIRQEDGAYPGADNPLLLGTARSPDDLDALEDSAGPLCFCVMIWAEFNAKSSFFYPRGIFFL